MMLIDVGADDEHSTMLCSLADAAVRCIAIDRTIA